MSGRAHLHHRLAGEEDAAIGNRAHRAGEAQLRQMVEELGLEETQRLQIFERHGLEVKILEDFEHALQSGRDHVSATGRKAAHPDIEGGDAVHPALEEGRRYREFVEVIEDARPRAGRDADLSALVGTLAETVAAREPTRRQRGGSGGSGGLGAGGVGGLSWTMRVSRSPRSRIQVEIFCSR